MPAAGATPSGPEGGLVRAVLDLPAERFACDADAGTSSQDLWTRKAPLKSIKYTLSSEKRN